MDYKKIHDSIIRRAKESNREKGGDTYYEAHHIVPLCLGGEGTHKDWKWHPNIVLLTAREHFIIHRILALLHPEEDKLQYAFTLMCFSKTSRYHHGRTYAVTSRTYQEARETSKRLRLNNPRARKKTKIIYDTWTGRYYAGIRKVRSYISKEHLDYGTQSGRFTEMETLPAGQTYSEEKIQIPKRMILDRRTNQIMGVLEWRRKFGNSYAIDKHIKNGDIDFVWLRN